MKGTQRLLYAILSGVLLTVAWPNIGNQFYLIFVALIPLFLVEDDLQKNPSKKFSFLNYSFLTFIIFNVATTWWVWNASAGGSVAAFLLNAFFQACMFQLFHFAKKNLRSPIGNHSIIYFMLGWEYLHMRWDLTWPWLTFGNVFAIAPSWVQWYEYTGVPGGTLWILLANLLLAKLVIGLRANAPQLAIVRHAIKTALVVLIPISVSLFMYYSYEEQGEQGEVIVYQPNIDPYQKFNDRNDEVISEMMQQVDPLITEKTVLVAAPETFLPRSLEEDAFDNSFEWRKLRNWATYHPNTEFIIGASTRVIYEDDAPISATARFSERYGFYYDYCNTAIGFNHTPQVEFYHKSKMVPGVEKMPFPKLFLPLQEVVFNLGGTTGSIAGQENREVFTHGKGAYAPIICYESVYGEFVGEYVQRGANLLVIITNDGWWGNTPGYRQHFNYARLRAIEQRRDVVRSANTGTSGFINQRGDVVQATDYWVKAVEKSDVYLNNEKTLYAEYGDYLSRIAGGFGILMLLIAIGQKFKPE